MKIRHILALLALSTVLAGCDTDPMPPVTSDSSAETTTAPVTEAPPAPLTLAADGKTAYTILYPTDAPSEIVAASREIRADIEQASGARLDCTSDETPDWITLPETAPEILLGLTNREASRRAYSELGSAADYIIRVDGEAIVIVGGSQAATLEAVRVFRETYLSATAATLTLPGDLSLLSLTTYSLPDATLTRDSRYFTFTLTASTGEELPCRLSFTDHHAWRLQTKAGDLFTDGAAQQLADFFDEDKPCPAVAVTAKQDGDMWTLTAPDGSSVKIGTAPFSLTVCRADGTVATEILSLTADKNGATVALPLADGEAIFGSGERFNTVNQRGQRIDMTAIDIWAGIEGNSYMPIPLLLSSRGTGYFMNRYERMTIDVGAAVEDRLEIAVAGAPMDLYLYATEQMSDVLFGYASLTGFAPEVADWMYGTAVCRYAPDFTTPDGVYAMAKAMEENGFPWDTVILEGWNAYDETRWDELKNLVDTLHGMGKKVLVYSTTGRAINTKLPLALHVHRADNGDCQLPDATSYNPVDNPNSKTSRYVDITNATAWAWWTKNVWNKLIDYVGVDGSKIDFCEQFPDFIELKFADGKTSGAHHWYPTFYNTLMYNLFSEKEDGGMVLARGGGIGAQRYPFIWAGDQRREYQYLAAQLKACLSAGMSGVPFMSFDAAGYRPAQNSDVEADVFERGIAFTAFTANIQTHGTVSRPYDFPEDTKAIYRRYALIHEALRPYLEEQGKIASETGMPLMRHLALMFQSDAEVYGIDDEYMLGEGLLVAPILTKEDVRDIYLPAGQWKNIFTGEVHDGGVWLRGVQIPRGEIAVFERLGHGSDALGECLADVADVE